MNKNNEKAKVRNCKELGSNLIKIFSILKKDQDLLRLLYYTDKDPLNKEKPDITDEQYRSEIYEKLISDGDKHNIRLLIQYLQDYTSIPYEV